MNDDYSIDTQLHWLEQRGYMSDFLSQYQEDLDEKETKEYHRKSENIVGYNIVALSIPYSEFWCDVANEMEFDLLSSIRWAKKSLNETIKTYIKDYPEALI